MSFLSEEDSVDGRSWIEICESDLSHASDSSTRNEGCYNKSTGHESIEEGKVRNGSFSTPLKGIQENSEITHQTTATAKETNGAVKGSLSYAEILQSRSPSLKNKPTEHQKVAINDDLSLTSHLDVFHMASPVKGIKTQIQEDISVDEDTLMHSPQKKEEVNVINMKRPFNLIESPVSGNIKNREMSSGDRRIHNSGGKPTRKVAKSNHAPDVHSVNNHVNNDTDTGSCCSEENEQQTGDRKKASSSNSKRELEVNPDVLSRRQKQIDYGKNTLEYDRYLKLIPKQKRSKDHPKTPPKHLKMSRRTWDGLIKNWRLKLHRWDPVSEADEIDFDNVNFDQYSFSSEDPSSYDSSSVQSDSTSSTPRASCSKLNTEGNANTRTTKTKTESSKELWSDCSKDKAKSDDDEFLGCEPLSEHCVKAFS